MDFFEVEEKFIFNTFLTKNKEFNEFLKKREKIRNLMNFWRKEEEKLEFDEFIEKKRKIEV